MSSQFVNLDSLFDGPQDAPQPRGIGRSSSVDLDSIFRTSEEAKDDVRIGKYRFAGAPEARLEAPERRGIGQRFADLGESIDDTITDVFGTNVPNPEDIRPEGLAQVEAEQAQDQEIIQRRRAELGTDSPDRGLFMRSFDSIAGGAAGMSGSVLEYLGRQFGSETIEQLGKSVTLEGAALTPEGQNFFEKVMGGVGSALPLVTAGVVSALGGLKIGLGLKGTMILASSSSALLESAAIAQEAYEGALQETGNEARAETQGYKAGVINVPLSFIANRIGIFGAGGSRVRQTGKAFVAEGIEEGAQAGLTNYLGYQPTGEGVSEEAAIGAFTGGIIKQFTFSPDRRKPQPSEGKAADRDGEKAPEEAPVSPVPESDLPEGVRNLGFQEVYQTLRTNPAVAGVLYQEATTQQQKELVLRAVDRAEIQREFKEVLGDPTLLEDTRRQMQDFPEFTDSLSVSILPFVTNMPPANIFKADRRTPSEAEVANQFDQAWEDAGFQAELEQDAATLLLEAEERQQNRRPAFQAEQTEQAQQEVQEVQEVQEQQAVETAVAEATETTVEQDVSAIEAQAREEVAAQAETFNASEATQLNDQNRVGFEAYFGDIADQVAILQNPEVRKEAYEGALTQMTDVGFTEQQARAILDAGQPQVEPATGKAGLFQQASTLLAVRNRDDSAAFQPAKLPAYFNDIAKALGVDVVAYTYSGNNETSANRAGTYMRGPSGRGLVAINLSRSQDGALFVLGHEVFHDFQRRFPAQAKQLAQEVKQYVQAERVQVYEQYYGERKQSDKTDGEIAADVMGQMFTDRQFWQSVSQKNPSLVQRVIQIIDSVIAKFRGTSNRMEIAQYINQYEQVREMLASFVADNVATRGRPVEGGPVVEAMDDFGGQQTGRPAQAERLFPALDDATAPAAQPSPAAQQPTGDAQTVQQVLGLLREGKTGPAAKLFRENELFQKGFGSFTDLQKQSRAFTTPDSEVSEADVAGVTFTAEPARKPKKPAAKKAAEPAVKAPVRGTQQTLGLGLLRQSADTPRQAKLRGRLEGIVRNALNYRFFEDTFALLNKQISDIDQRIKQLDRIEVEGKTFRARSEEDAMPGLWGIYDENAYDRFEQGLVMDKPSNKSELLAARRKLVEELDRARGTSVRSKARLYFQGRNRMMDQMMTATQNAMSGGMSETEARAVFSEFYRAASFDPTAANRVQPTIEEGVVEQGIQEDAFVGERAAMGLAADFKSKAITNRQLESLIDEGLREGDFTHMDLSKAFNAYNVSLPRGVLNTSSQLSVRKRLKDFLSENGNTFAARMEWMVNMEKVVALNPGSLQTKFTADEVAYYNLFTQDRQALRQRRKRTPEMGQAKTAEEAFPNLLFNRFRLNQVRNPDLIQESESTRSAVRAIAGGDPDTVYFEDVAHALRRRPDLESDIFESMTAEEGRQFRAWIDAKKRAIAQESKMLAKAEAFTTLRNLGHADAILGLPDPILTSEPGRAEDAPDTSPKERERIYARLVNAELNEMPAIMDSMARLNSMLNGRIDPETGEIMTDAQAEQAAADYVDSLLQKSLLGSVVNPNTGAEMGQFGATMGFGDDAPAGLRRGEFGFGETVEQAGEAMQAGGSRIISELSTEEQLQNEQLSEAEFVDLAERMNAEADAEIEARSAPETEVAEDRADRSIRNEIPGSLVGDKDYRFRHAPFSGELTNSVVAEHVLKISSKWAGAPRINVLPNVQMLPAELRDKVMARLTKDLGAAGLFYNGEVYLFSDHLTSLSDAEFTLFHETYGHYGMRAFLGTQFDDFLQRAYNTNARIKTEVDALMADKPIGLLEAVDEVLSDMAATNQPVGMVKQWMGRVIAGLREIGMTRVSGWLSTKTDAEIGYTLAMARRSVQEGDPAIFNGAPDEVRLAEARLPYEMFSSRGGETTAYTRYNPVTQTYAVFTATGKNIRDGWETQVVDKFEDAIELMRKQGKVERRTRSGLYVDNKIPSDLQKLPDFMNDTTDLSFTSIADLKKRGQNIWRTSVMYFQNEYKPVMTVVDHLRAKGRIDDSFDPTNDLDGLHERRTAEAIKDMKRRIVQPLMELVKEGGPILGKTLNDSGLNLPAGVIERLGTSTVLDACLIAKHAAERNKHIAGINPNAKDGGSGMFTADADAVLNALRGQKALPKLEEISVLLQQLSNEKLTVMRESGMISHDEFMARAKYKNYVNLSGFKDGLDGFDSLQALSGSSKLSTSKDKRALGRGDVTAEVLARTIQSAESAILNASKNKLKQKILTMLEVNYDPDFVAINKQPYRRVLDENGEVTEKIDESYIRNKNVMVVHVNGRPNTVEFKKVGAGTFADAIHGAIYPSQSENFLLQASGQFNRIVGQMLTTWNPAWTMVNFTRDSQTMYFNAVADKRVSEKMARDMFKSLPKAMQATANHFTDGRRFAKADQGMIDAFNEMRQTGGATSFMNFQGLDRQVQDIQDMIRPDQVSNVKKAGMFLATKLEAFNMPIELAPRLAAYKVLRDNGWTKEAAAQFAGEITVNFNLRGSSKLMRNLYLFFNPAIQGSAKIGKLMVSNPKTFSSIAMGMVLTGFMSSIFSRMVGGEDEDGIDKIDKIPFFKRATTILIPNPLSTGDRPFVSIPVPYGWNAFFAAGSFMADSFFGDTTPEHTSKRIFEAAFEGFSPIGTAGLDSQTWSGVIAKGIAPTATLPIVEMILNENRFGAPIVKQASMYGGGMRPNAEMAFDSVSPISAGIFKGLNRATGGDYVNPGTIDINPGIVDHLIRSYVPGLGAEVYSLSSWATRQAIGQETRTATVPLFDRFVGKIPQGYNYGMYRRAKEEISTKYDDFRLNESRRDQVLEEFPELGAARGVITTTDSRMQDLRQYRQAIMRDESLSRSERMDIYNQTREREREIINTAVSTLMEIRPELKPTMIASE
jgi:hypothetical protein